MNEIGRACSTHGEMRNAYKIWVGSPVRKRPLRRPRLRWEDNIKMVFQEIGWEGVDWTYVVQIGTGGGLL
jgi:hypothetical protein